MSLPDYYYTVIKNNFYHNAEKIFQLVLDYAASGIISHDSIIDLMELMNESRRLKIDPLDVIVSKNIKTITKDLICL